LQVNTIAVIVNGEIIVQQAVQGNAGLSDIGRSLQQLSDIAQPLIHAVLVPGRRVVP